MDDLAVLRRFVEEHLANNSDPASGVFVPIPTSQNAASRTITRTDFAVLVEYASAFTEYHEFRNNWSSESR